MLFNQPEELDNQLMSLLLQHLFRPSLIPERITWPQDRGLNHWIWSKQKHKARSLRSWMDGMLKQQQYQQKGSNRFLSSFKFLYLRINGQRFSFPSTIFSCSQSWSFHHFLPPSRMIKRRLAFLPGWTADWCQCQGSGCRVIFGRSGKIRHIDLKSTGNLRGFLIFLLSDALGTENDFDCWGYLSTPKLEQQAGIAVSSDCFLGAVVDGSSQNCCLYPSWSSWSCCCHLCRRHPPVPPLSPPAPSQHHCHHPHHSWLACLSCHSRLSYPPPQLQHK